ncbi:hypothetical protein [Flavimarina sp. Hel_I_48]|uniref:hypothetical protein n=1 Tax=Flavimarina sp. Hel_I_48 TaxID=1392488 RepID=UPI0004DF0793|nr:hypothetical protein [Flavimarina sp. Hel_I_48]
MVTDDNKMYVLKVKYTLIDVTKKKSKRKITRKKEKLYLVKDPDTVDDKLKELEHYLLEEQEPERSNVLHQCQEFLKNFGNRCNRTYFSILRA